MLNVLYHIRGRLSTIFCGLTFCALTNADFVCYNMGQTMTYPTKLHRNLIYIKVLGRGWEPFFKKSSQENTMNNSFFACIFRQKYIRRWGLMRNVSSESLAEHSAQVAMLAHALALIGNKRLGKSYDLGAVTVAALYHDGTEVYTGDLPTPVKYHSPELRQSYKVIEEQAALTLLSQLPEDLREDYAPLLREELPEEVYRLVKAADKLSAYIKCVEEVKFGNNEFADAKKTTFAALKQRSIPELEIFLDEFLPAFELSLDEVQG